MGVLAWQVRVCLVPGARVCVDLPYPSFLRMAVVGSIIARLGSRRLTYKNILPFGGVPMIGLGLQKLRQARCVDVVVVSTESELIARIAWDFGATVLRRPVELAGDSVPSVPVFQHIVAHYPCEVHVNLNVNFPLCDPEVIDRAVAHARAHGEALSVPFAVWAQSAERLANYSDPYDGPWKYPHLQFEDARAGAIDVHTEADLLEVYRQKQGPLPGWPRTAGADSVEVHG